ncbi:oxygenase MpaB family protein [Saccharothrix hoggarensis]|uniref:Oxygenase MpaB family protein n=1 Tax=Saccharothrix hoggarensis TaxID=913853 RepID=A0ABW3QV42_9PSEU
MDTEPLRRYVADALFTRVAGPDGELRRARIHDAPGPRWFGPDRPIRRVHGDAAMFIGGLRALLLQSLHPLAMAAVAGHSDYRDDPWGRLQRTSTFLATTTFGTAVDAQKAVDRVRFVHDRIKGVTAWGVPYHASDPHLLGWVHAAEVDSFLRCHQRYGANPLEVTEKDEYVNDMARVASAVGVLDPPTTVAELKARLAAYRPELRGTPAARDAARFLLLTPPVPLLVRGPYAALAAASVASLPAWTRLPLRLPLLPVFDNTVARLAGHGITRTLRWALPAAPTSATL